MPETTHRKSDSKYAKHEENVSFADGFPYLVISQASLDDLNSRLKEPVEMLRFRPNFVVTDTIPFAEDQWKLIQIGDIKFEVVKACARCVLTTIDPQTSKKGPEPLKTLATYRREKNSVLFGQNMIAREFGTVNLGDSVKILS